MGEIGRIKTLYGNGKSTIEVADELGVSGRRVIYLMEKYGIKRRSISEATYCKRNPYGDPFKKAEQYWSLQLDLPLAQFSKTVITAHRGKGTYKNKSLYGTTTICVHNAKLRKIIQDWLNKYAHVAQPVEHKHGKLEVTGSIPVVGLVNRPLSAYGGSGRFSELEN